MLNSELNPCILVMGKGLYGWLLSKWFFVFILSVLVLPELLEVTPGPSNEESCHLKKRKIIGYCNKCNYRAETEVKKELLFLF